MEHAPKRKLVIWLSILLAGIVLVLSFPMQTQWFITRHLVNSELGYEKYIKNYPKSPYLEQASWLHAKLKGKTAFYLDFATDFPKSPHHEEALWRAAKWSLGPELYAHYLDHYPEGKLAKRDGANVNRMRISAIVYRNEQKRLASLKYNKVVDGQGNTYRSIQIGKHIWLADNLNIDIPEESMCFMRHVGYCARFGKLYTWRGAREVCKKLGPNWRLPTVAEWHELCLAYDPKADMAKGSSKVFHALVKGSKSGFEVRGGGYFAPDDGGFLGVYYDASFWTASPMPSYPSKIFQVAFLSRVKQAFMAPVEKDFALSCRCVQDAPL